MLFVLALVLIFSKQHCS